MQHIKSSSNLDQSRIFSSLICIGAFLPAQKAASCKAAKMMLIQVEHPQQQVLRPMMRNMMRGMAITKTMMIMARAPTISFHIWLNLFASSCPKRSHLSPPEISLTYHWEITSRLTKVDQTRFLMFLVRGAFSMEFYVINS